jgi:hypothetical protein
MRTILSFALAGAALSFTLSGCGAADKKDAAAKGAAAKAPKMQPGEYESTMQIVRMDVPGMADDMKAKMQANLVGQKNSAKHCLTKQQADKDQGDMFKNIAANGGNCTMDSYKVNNGAVAGKMTCTGPTGSRGVMTLRGTVTDSGSDMNMIADMEDKTLPQGKAQMEMSVVTKRIGDCAA